MQHKACVLSNEMADHSLAVLCQEQKTFPFQIWYNTTAAMDFKSNSLYKNVLFCHLEISWCPILNNYYICFTQCPYKNQIPNPSVTAKPYMFSKMFSPLHLFEFPNQ